MSSLVCADASVFVKVLVQEEFSEQARQQWETWTIVEERRVIVPALFLYEVVAVLRKKVYQGQLALQDGAAAVDMLLDADIEPVTAPELHRRAWQLAERLHRPT
ncbi:MAG: type II toxin-antitoxin system VapC family toxin, partial [Anaerolineae bacterium]